MDEGSIVFDYSSPPGTSLEETDRILREVEKIIIAIPEVEAYSRRTGTQMGFFITEPNRGDYLIQSMNAEISQVPRLVVLRIIFKSGTCFTAFSNCRVTVIIIFFTGC